MNVVYVQGKGWREIKDVYVQGKGWMLDTVFENPDILEEYLRRYAPPGSYSIKWYAIAATRDALDAAEQGFQQECERTPLL